MIEHWQSLVAGFLFCVDCVYLKDGEYCADDCQQNCAEGHLKWLKQEHEGGD